ncbi:helix-turn-helix domain-containing protein [Lysinibacillus sp. G4S2]|uniref:helix-turn-helix domain-containing protein n=1 Tax=Lysinibacillus sp. G4S2 TaxID=3055859 RepID=UPI0025A26A4A|nr:helix-turn-helix domain-containing protein [Lysinibacillus sp. G4S2]MDM5248755.1 helix-turn-helix domain-containing protein [Lysinibacillus sp. G4S2]
MKDPIAVIGNFEQPGSIVLAASPVMKEKFKIKTGNRRYEIPKHPDIKLFEPKMSFFLEMSMAITRLISKYVPPECIHKKLTREELAEKCGLQTSYLADVERGDRNITLQTFEKITFKIATEVFSTYGK